MSNWIYIDDIEVTDKVNTIYCDTRDFHCSVREDKIDLRDARHPEITRVLHKDKYLIHQDEIKGFLKGLETTTDGNEIWRMMNFNGINACDGWLKYIRMYRVKGDYFVVCNNVNVPVDRSLMTEENFIERALLNHIEEL